MAAGDEGTRERVTTFVTTVEARDRGGIAILLPDDPASRWGDRDTYHVSGTVAGHGVRGALVATPSGHVLELGPAWCRDAHLRAGASVAVMLHPEGPQLDSIASDLAEAIAAVPQARRFFESLATFYRTGYVQWVEAAKRPQTRSRRIVETVDALSAGKKQRD